MSNYFFLSFFYVSFVQAIPLDILYNPQQRTIFVEFPGYILTNLVFILNNNAFLIFLYRKINAFHFYIRYFTIKNKYIFVS